MNDGGPAFPTHLSDEFIPIPSGGMGRAKEYGFESQPGMSLRDWFAGHVRIWRDSDGNMMGFDIGTISKAVGITRPNFSGNDYVAKLLWEIEVESAMKYLIADAMLKARGVPNAE